MAKEEPKPAAASHEPNSGVQPLEHHERAGGRPLSRRDDFDFVFSGGGLR